MKFHVQCLMCLDQSHGSSLRRRSRAAKMFISLQGSQNFHSGHMFSCTELAKFPFNCPYFPSHTKISCKEPVTLMIISTHENVIHSFSCEVIGLSVY